MVTDCFKRRDHRLMRQWSPWAA